MSLNSHSADALRDRLVPLLPEYAVTAVPWSSEAGEHIVTVWSVDIPATDPEDNDSRAQEALIDIFEVGTSYVLREVGSRSLLGRAPDPGGIPALVRAVLARSPR